MAQNRTVRYLKLNIQKKTVIKALKGFYKRYIKTTALAIRDTAVRHAHSTLGIVKLSVFGVLCVCLLLLCIMTRGYGKLRIEQSQMYAQAAAETAAQKPEPTATPQPTAETEREPEAIPEPGVTAPPEFDPAGDSSMITATRIQVNDEYVDHYQAAEGDIIDFLGGDSYSWLSGITTYRGNNFRDTAQYGQVGMHERAFGDYWSAQTSSLMDIDGNRLSGSGWTGQPLVACWPDELREQMDMYEWAREKSGLTELIYACQDGNIYFFDLESGSRTRDTISLGRSFLSGGTLDPRGYPILYLGVGKTNEDGEVPSILIVSLLDGSVLYETGAYDSFAAHWNAPFTSTPLVDASSDQLIFPGENGVLYIIKLNSYYNAESGEVSVAPSRVIKWKYTSKSAANYLYGYQSSAIAWRGHLLLADRGGDFFCLDLNTLTVDWCVDSLDLTRCTPVLQVDAEGHPYVYLSTSFHYGFRAYYQQNVPVWKIDALTGEIVWQTDYLCYTENGADGGVIGGLAVGTGSLSGIVYATVARSPEADAGCLVALDAATGEELWRFEADYSYAAPTCFYDTAGNGYVLYVSRENGALYLLDGETGRLYDEYDFGVRMESSPIVANDSVVVGTSSYDLFAIELK